MRLELNTGDLKPEFKELPTSQVKFEHLDPVVQKAVKCVGKATFYRDKGTHAENYNVVYPT